MSKFAHLAEMKQNLANLAIFLLMIWRNALKVIKYRTHALSALEMRILSVSIRGQ